MIICTNKKKRNQRSAVEIVMFIIFPFETTNKEFKKMNIELKEKLMELVCGEILSSLVAPVCRTNQ